MLILHLISTKKKTFINVKPFFCLCHSPSPSCFAIFKSRSINTNGTHTYTHCACMSLNKKKLYSLTIHKSNLQNSLKTTPSYSTNTNMLSIKMRNINFICCNRCTHKSKCKYLYNKKKINVKTKSLQ